MKRLGRQKGTGKLQKPHVSTDEIIRLYASGKTTYEIAPLVGLAQPSVTHRLKMAGVPRRTKWERHAKIPLSEAVALYEGGMNGNQVAQAAGISATAMRCALRRVGIAIRPAKATPRFGPAHHSWVGGRYKRNDGYIWVRVGKRNKPEHRLFMEAHLNRQLTRAEIVHHLNGIRHDNRLENLVVTTLKDHEHYTYVKALQSRIRILENLLISINKSPNRKKNGPQIRARSLSPK